ncbi:hypothetical protein [Nocardia sp. NPDC050710]|uniref:hypothetical protein n=1 Tax=Nocardia sp. NPDC050710 TaxID=3157220 RepID=UPI00340F2DB1
MAGSLVANFPVSDAAASSDIAYCRWEPEVFGDLVETLTELIEETERSDDKGGDLAPEQRDRSGASTALMDLQRGITVELPAVIRHAVSARWRREFDERPVAEAINRAREVVWFEGAEPTFRYADITFDLWGSGDRHMRAVATFAEASGQPAREAIVVVVKENSVWRVDSVSWTD